MRRMPIPDAVLSYAQDLLDQHSSLEDPKLSVSMDTKGTGTWLLKLSTRHVVTSMTEVRPLVERWPYGAPLSLSVNKVEGGQLEVSICSNHLLAASSGTGMAGDRRETVLRVLTS